MKTIKTHNVETNEIFERDLTKEELKQRSVEDAEFLSKKVKAKEEADAKEIAKAEILERIGLTADELKTILG